jgi:pyruvate formate lyase activating enzyme
VDYIAMDIKTEPSLYPWFTQGRCSAEDIHSSIQSIMESGLDYEFRTTCVRPIVDERTVEHIARRIQGARSFALQQFHNVEILKPEYFRGFKAGYDDDEMMRLKSAAEPFVSSCVVRQSLMTADYLKAA